jgi:hypothetical protein
MWTQLRSELIEIVWLVSMLTSLLGLCVGLAVALAVIV